MNHPLVRLEPPQRLVGDTCALMNDVVQGTRNARLTSLIVALNRDSVRLFIPRHVLDEVNRRLSAYATDRGVDAHRAMARWQRYYLPCTTVVDVPQNWGAGNPLVEGVAARHALDAPAARLAAALAPCFVLTEDGDLTAFGFGNPNWLPLMHAFANHAELELLVGATRLPTGALSVLAMEGGRAFMRLPRWAQFLLAVLAAASIYWWQRDGRARRHADRIKALASGVWRVVEPPLAELMARRTEGVATRMSHELQPSDTLTTAEQIARILALGPSGGMLAPEIADQLTMSGRVSDRVAAVRATLLACPALTRVGRWRWRLGTPASADEPTLTLGEIREWLTNAHANTLPPLPRRGQDPPESLIAEQYWSNIDRRTTSFDDSTI